MPDDPYSSAAASASNLAELTGASKFDVAVVLGSGWSAAIDELGPTEAEVDLGRLGGFAAPTVPGHDGSVRCVRIGDKKALVFLGRVHLYEGHSPATVVHPVRTAIAAGCRIVVLTNAAGGIGAGYQPGQPVLISDQLNLTGQSPLAGPPPPEGYAARFADMSAAYSPRLRSLAQQADAGLAEGVYAALPGPHYETPAEIAMLRTLGADLVGMSTALEAIAARHLGAEVLGISLVTNLAAGLSPTPLNHEEVIATANSSAARIGALLSAVIPAS